MERLKKGTSGKGEPLPGKPQSEQRPRSQQDEAGCTNSNTFSCAVICGSRTKRSGAMESKKG